MKPKRGAQILALGAVLCCLSARGLAAQTGSIGGAAAGQAGLALTRIQLFSSGVAYYEYSGILRGDARINLSFSASEIDDLLKSLVVWNDEGGTAEGKGAAGVPVLSYAGYAGLDESLKKLKIDLSGNPGIADILSRLRGAEVMVDSPKRLKGRIVAAELRRGDNGDRRTWVTLALSAPDSGLAGFALEDCASLRFSDPAVAGEFTAALDLIADSRGDENRGLELLLPGPAGQSRKVSLGYVIGAPVWKMSYRLDLGGTELGAGPASGSAASAAAGALPASSVPTFSLFQGWAVVDNDTGSDWVNVNLSLSGAKPVSFIERLYAPYRLSRPVLPLPGAGSAAPVEYDMELSRAPEALMEAASDGRAMKAAAPQPSGNGAGGLADGARAEESGDAFEFVLRQPVSLPAGRSAMFAVITAPVSAGKYSIWTRDQSQKHPMLGARLSNTSGTALPAGPLTVYDAGSYLGDALISYWPAGEERLIGYASDMSIDGSDAGRTETRLEGISISGAVLKYRRSRIASTTYVFRNSSDQIRSLIVEHPITRSDSVLVQPAGPMGKTERYYRFSVELPPHQTKTFEVRESWPEEETTALGDIARLSDGDFLRLCSTRDIPEPARKALSTAIDLWRKSDAAGTELKNIAADKTSLSADEERLRANIESFGRTSAQGKEYQKKLLEIEKKIEALDSRAAAARRNADAALEAYRKYISELVLN